MSTPRGTPLPSDLDETTVSIEIHPKTASGDFTMEEALVDSRPVSAMSHNDVIVEQPQRLSPLPNRWASSHNKLNTLWILNAKPRQEIHKDTIAKEAGIIRR